MSAVLRRGSCIVWGTMVALRRLWTLTQPVPTRNGFGSALAGRPTWTPGRVIRSAADMSAGRAPLTGPRSGGESGDRGGGGSEGEGGAGYRGSAGEVGDAGAAGADSVGNSRGQGGSG